MGRQISKVFIHGSQDKDKEETATWQRKQNKNHLTTMPVDDSGGERASRTARRAIVRSNWKCTRRLIKIDSTIKVSHSCISISVWLIPAVPPTYLSLSLLKYRLLVLLQLMTSGKPQTRYASTRALINLTNQPRSKFEIFSTETFGGFFAPGPDSAVLEYTVHRYKSQSNVGVYTLSRLKSL